MAEVTLSSKNQIVLPKEARERLDAKPGDKLLVTVLENKVIVIEKPKDYPAALRNLGPISYGEDYLKKERESWD